MDILRLTVFLLLLQLPFLVCSSAYNNASSHDEAALLAFRSGITFDPHHALLAWSHNTSFCNWSGVTCTPHMRVSEIDLANRDLAGVISPFLGNLSYLWSLNLSNNMFYGNIPPELGHKLGNLQYLVLRENQLMGTIPASIGNCSKLEILSLSFNALTGLIPATIGNCSKLEILSLADNNLTGMVPLGLGKLSSLRSLMLDHNFLTGRTLPFLTALVNCSVLRTLYLGYNNLTGVLPPSIGKLSSNLSILSLPYNQIGGNIPQQIGNLTNLITIDFGGNLFIGTIPPILGRLHNLQRLYLEQNQFQGSIPSEIGTLPSALGLLSVSFNLLSGQIPETLGNLPQLRRLYLNHNQLQGRIPANLGNSLTLELIDLSYNQLTGKIPPEVAGLKNLAFFFNLSWNLLEGSLPSEIGKMVMVQGIDLSGNQLSGVISSTFGSCIALEYLNLSHNAFMGPIPNSVADLKYLQSMDLSNNDLSGMIPEALRNRTMLRFLNLSFNSLTGEIPKTGLFANLTATSFMGNPGLCGEWIASLRPCKSLGKSGGLLKLITAGIFSLMGYCLYIAFLWKCISGKPNVELCLELPHPRISYKELSTATNGFCKGNLLGVGSAGSVYKGVLDNGTLVAVKALNLQSEAAHTSFRTECQVLGKAMHRNVIRVITSCSNLDFKGLVLEFMSNGNLESHLYCDSNMCNIGGVCKMNLQTVFQIAIDIARGLAYLHHDCSIQVVHCDLKPSNVLLDYYMTARVADFGNAQILSENSMHSFSSPTALKGTLGYISPEYGVGARISTKGDVYSYGVVLLEMVTRKRPTSQMFVDGLSLRLWVSMAFPNRILDVIDNSLLQCNGALTDAVGNCLVQLIRVALLCTKDSPKDRPSMAEVVELLESIEEMFEGSRLDSKYPSDLYQMVSSRRRARNVVGALKGQSTSTLDTSS